MGGKSLGKKHGQRKYDPEALRPYRSGMKVAEDILYSDHDAAELIVAADRTELAADGHSVALVDVCLQDQHGVRYELEDRKVSWQVDGAPCRVRIDNGNAWSTLPFDAKEMPLYNGHILLILQAGHKKGEAHLQLNVEGFEERTLTFIFR